MGQVEKCDGLFAKGVSGVEAEVDSDGDSIVEDEHQEDVPQEAAPPKVASRPYTPTKAEVEAHEVTHLPYRSWCAHCVAGKGVSSPHRHDAECERIGITVSIDYCFMGDEEVEGTPPTLVMWDDGHRAMWVLPVDRKGPVEYVVAWIIRKLDEAGYSGVPLTLKSDQEPMIKDLKTSVALRRQGATSPIESPVRESQSNGTIERAIRSWHG